MREPALTTVAQARRVLEYDRRVFERFVRRLRRLPWAEVRQDREIGHHTLFQTMVHILHVHEGWLVYILRGRARELQRYFPDPSRHPNDWRAFERFSKHVWAGVAETLDGLTDRDLFRRVRAPWMPGDYSIGDAILQTTFEEAHHLGEVIGALWQDDVSSPAMTWIEVLREPRRRRPRAARARRPARRR